MRKTIILMAMCIMLAGAVNAVDDQTYYTESLDYVSFNLSVSESFALSSQCPTMLDWDDDNYLDLVAKTNYSNGSQAWTIFINDGDYKTWTPIYNFTYPTNTYDGGTCAIFADLDDDGDHDLFSYSIGVVDTNVYDIYNDYTNKTGGRGFFENTGDNDNPVFVLNNDFDNFAGISNPLSNGNTIRLSVDEYNYISGKLPAPYTFAQSVCDVCTGGRCTLSNSPVCYGYYAWPSNPYVRYEFVDIDFDYDFDLIASRWDHYDIDVFENFGDSSRPYFSENSEDFLANNFSIECGYDPYFFDWDSDGDLDLFSTDAQSGVNTEKKLMRCVNNGWDDFSQRDTIESYSNIPASGLFSYDSDYEPTSYGTHSEIMGFFDYDSDNDLDVFIYSYDGTHDIDLYISNGYGNATPYYFYESDQCVSPCILEEDFNKYPDGFEINDLSEWFADDCVTVEDNMLVINGTLCGGGTSSFACVNFPEDIYYNGTLAYSIRSDERCGFYASHTLFYGEVILNQWDNTSGNYLYNYEGISLGRTALSAHNNSLMYDWTALVDLSSDYYHLVYNEFDDYAGVFGTGQDSIGFMCFYANDNDSVCYIDDLSVYKGVEDVPTNRSLKCFAGYCWDKDGDFEDSRPSGYTPQTSQMGNLFFFNYDKCIEKGYKPNMWCILKLGRDDVFSALKDWFFDNIILVFILLTLGSILVIILGRSRGK